MEHFRREATAAKLPDIPAHSSADLLHQLVVEVIVATVQSGSGVPADAEPQMNRPDIKVQWSQVNDSEESLNEEDLIVECPICRQFLPAIEAQQTIDDE